MGKPCKNGWTNQRWLFVFCCILFTACRYTSMLYAVAMCPLHAGIVSKRLHVESCKQCHMITQRLLIYSTIWLILCEAASHGPSPTSDILVMVVSSGLAFFLTPMHHQNGLFCVKWDVQLELSHSLLFSADSCGPKERCVRWSTYGWCHLVNVNERYVHSIGASCHYHYCMGFGLGLWLGLA